MSSISTITPWSSSIRKPIDIKIYDLNEFTQQVNAGERFEAIISIQDLDIHSTSALDPIIDENLIQQKGLSVPNKSVLIIQEYDDIDKDHKNGPQLKHILEIQNIAKQLDILYEHPRVAIQSTTGVGRSSAVAFILLMELGYTLDKAWLKVITQRINAEPNKQLLRLYAQLTGLPCSPEQMTPAVWSSVFGSPSSSFQLQP